MPKSSRKKIALSRLVDDQRNWIAEHGRDQAGYVKQYGDPGTGRCCGAGGSAIYSADVTALAVLVGKLRKAHGRPGPELQPEDVSFAILSASKSSLNPANHLENLKRSGG
jgi:hypothetical protein